MKRVYYIDPASATRSKSRFSEIPSLARSGQTKQTTARSSQVISHTHAPRTHGGRRSPGTFQSPHKPRMGLTRVQKISLASYCLPAGRPLASTRPSSFLHIADHVPSCSLLPSLLPTVVLSAARTKNTTTTLIS